MLCPSQDMGIHCPDKPAQDAMLSAVSTSTTACGRISLTQCLSGRRVPGTDAPLTPPPPHSSSSRPSQIARGSIVMQAFPFNAELSLLDPQLFSASLGLTQDLARQFGVDQPRTLSQRDVPGKCSAGHSRRLWVCCRPEQLGDIPHGQLTLWMCFMGSVVGAGVPRAAIPFLRDQSKSTPEPPSEVTPSSAACDPTPCPHGPALLGRMQT